MPIDDSGFLGRECPTCQRYFKLMPGTGIQGSELCHCPYCGHEGGADQFFTKDQIEFAKSVALQYAHGEIWKMLKRHEGPLGRQDGFIKLSIKVTGDSPPPLFEYRERDLETELTCTGCTLRYTIYGVFAFCPDCGQHNSPQILNKNLETIERMLNLADQHERQLRLYIIEDALENAVSAFDGFGREFVRILSRTASGTSTTYSFQNIVAARDRLIREHGIDMAAGLLSVEWESVIRGFQKRHLLAHCMSIVDDRYLAATHDPGAQKGTKVSIDKEEVQQVMGALRKIAASMQGAVSGNTPGPISAAGKIP
jgi:hypothetical protein